MRHAACITSDLIAALPASLTCLVLAGAGPGLSQFSEGGVDSTKSIKISQHTTPRLGQLTCPKGLMLHGISVDCDEDGSLTGLFSGLTQLTSLSMNAHSLIAGSNTDVNHSPSLAEFLAGMGCLTGLRSLRMIGGFRCFNWGSDMEEEEDLWDEEFADLAPLCAGEW